MYQLKQKNFHPNQNISRQGCCISVQPSESVRNPLFGQLHANVCSNKTDLIQQTCRLQKFHKFQHAIFEDYCFLLTYIKDAPKTPPSDESSSLLLSILLPVSLELLHSKDSEPQAPINSQTIQLLHTSIWLVSIILKNIFYEINPHLIDNKLTYFSGLTNKISQDDYKKRYKMTMAFIMKVLPVLFIALHELQHT